MSDPTSVTENYNNITTEMKELYTYFIMAIEERIEQIRQRMDCINPDIKHKYELLVKDFEKSEKKRKWISDMVNNINEYTTINLVVSNCFETTLLYNEALTREIEKYRTLINPDNTSHLSIMNSIKNIKDNKQLSNILKKYIELISSGIRIILNNCEYHRRSNDLSNENLYMFKETFLSLKDTLDDLNKTYDDAINIYDSLCALRT